MEQYLVSKVWHIHSLFGRVTPGLLLKQQERIRFITEEGIQFDEPLSSLTHIKWPFLRMGLGFDARVNGKKYQFSFAKPNPAAPELDDELMDQALRFTDIGRIDELLKTLRNLRADKETTKKWKEVLKR
jgi:hypothetical protein